MFGERSVLATDQEDDEREKCYSDQDKCARSEVMFFHLFLPNQVANGFVLMMFEFFRPTEGNQISFVENSETVSNPPCAMHVVCHDHYRGLVQYLLFKKEIVNLRSRDPVETAAWLVDEQDIRFEYQCARETCALSHTAGECARQLVFVACQSNLFECLIDDFLNLRIR